LKKKLTRAKAPLPKFTSDAEAAAHLGNHSAELVWDDLEKVRPQKLTKVLSESIRERHRQAKGIARKKRA